MSPIAQSILLVATIFKSLANAVVANTGARLLAALPYVTSGRLLVEPSVNVVHVASPPGKPAVAIRQPFIVAFGAVLSVVCLHRYYTLA